MYESRYNPERSGEHICALASAFAYAWILSFCALSQSVQHIAWTIRLSMFASCKGTARTARVAAQAQNRPAQCMRELDCFSFTTSLGLDGSYFLHMFLIRAPAVGGLWHSAGAASACVDLGAPFQFLKSSAISAGFTTSALLDSSIFGNNSFGKRQQWTVDGAVQAQPLYAPGISLVDGSPTNMLLVVTEHATLFALDAGAHLPIHQQPEVPQVLHYISMSLVGEYIPPNSLPNSTSETASCPTYCHKREGGQESGD